VAQTRENASRSDRGDSARYAGVSVTIRAKLGEEALTMRLRVPPVGVFVQCCFYGRRKKKFDLDANGILQGLGL